MKGSEKNEKKRGGLSHLARARAKQGMEGRACRFRHFFCIRKGRFPAIWNEIRTKTKGEQLRQRCSPTLWEKTMKEGGWREEDGRGRAKKSEWDGDGEGSGMQEDT